MKQILDLHIHSRYSRACSPKLTLDNIDKACREKGIDIIGTGDFTHPAWFKSISSELEEIYKGAGLYKLKKAPDDKIKFILSTEVSLIYKDKEKVRKIHLVVHAPSLEAVRELNKKLGKKYNIKSDGRPILGIKAPEFVRLLLNINKQFLIYPAHIWTPWFAVFGSKSGFDSLEECFGKETKNIYAFETGLSSDPDMNLSVPSLFGLSILSSSDAHSLGNIGREATVMNFKEPISYKQIYEIIRYNKRGASSGMLATIEFYSEEGMYHFDGHRKCNFSCSPEESRKLKNICPICNKKLTIGVLNRIKELSDKSNGLKLNKSIPFKKVIGLDKIIAEALGVKSRLSVKVRKVYDNLIAEFGSELFILLDLDVKELKNKVDLKVIEGIKRVRAGKVLLQPGFDGKYGEVRIFFKNKIKH